MVPHKARKGSWSGSTPKYLNEQQLEGGKRGTYRNGTKPTELRRKGGLRWRLRQNRQQTRRGMTIHNKIPLADQDTAVVPASAVPPRYRDCCSGLITAVVQQQVHVEPPKSRFTPLFTHFQRLPEQQFQPTISQLRWAKVHTADPWTQPADTQSCTSSVLEVKTLLNHIEELLGVRFRVV